MLTDALLLDDGRDPLARGVALAMLAQQDPAYLPRADQALRAVDQSAPETGWILVHLAEARMSAGRAAEAGEAAAAVDRDYFDREDLHWRSVRMDEIRCAALLRMGRPREGAELAERVCAELAVRGDTDDLAPPDLLAEAALDLLSGPDAGTGCAVLRMLAGSIELDSWFPAGLVLRIRRGLAECDQG